MLFLVTTSSQNSFFYQSAIKGTSPYGTCCLRLISSSEFSLFAREQLLKSSPSGESESYLIVAQKSIILKPHFQLVHFEISFLCIPPQDETSGFLSSLILRDDEETDPTSPGLPGGKKCQQSLVFITHLCCIFRVVELSAIPCYFIRPMAIGRFWCIGDWGVVLESSLLGIFCRNFFRILCPWRSNPLPRVCS